MSDSRTSFSIGVIAIAVVFGTGVSPSALRAQQKDEAFKEGLEALDKDKWQEAAAHMRRATQEDPTESNRKVRRGLRDVFGGTEYLPHFFLGEALFNLGECAGALDAWDISEQQAVVRAHAKYVGVLEKGRAACEAKGFLLRPKYLPLLSRTRQHVTDVTVLAKDIQDKYPNQLRGTIREQYDRASGELQNAHNGLSVATRTRIERHFVEANNAAERVGLLLKSVEAQAKAIKETTNTAETLYKEVEGLHQELDTQLRGMDAKKAILASQPSLAGERQHVNDVVVRGRAQLPGAKGNIGALRELLRSSEDAVVKVKALNEKILKAEGEVREARFTASGTAAEQALQLVVAGFDTIAGRVAQKPDGFTPELSAQRDALRTEADALRRRLDGARRARSVARIDEITRAATELRAKLDDIIRIFGPLTIHDVFRPELIEGARSYFDGDYDRALATLDMSRLGGIRHEEHVHLFRAAALHALYVRSGAKDETLRKQAASEVDRCRQLNASLEPDLRAFGPRFLAFFKSVPAASAAPSPPLSQ